MATGQLATGPWPDIRWRQMPALSGVLDSHCHFDSAILLSGQNPVDQQPDAMSFTHIDSSNAPSMVDVSAKSVTHRTATAETRVRFPSAVARALEANGFHTAKGPVFHTAIIAGTMAAKRTHELIPFCHPLGIETCTVAVEMEGSDAVVRCTVSVHHKTGVEMEALTVVSVAALTVYDMCKSVDRGMRIENIQLEEKSGGRSGYWSRETT